MPLQILWKSDIFLVSQANLLLNNDIELSRNLTFTITVAQRFYSPNNLFNTLGARSICCVHIFPLKSWYFSGSQQIFLPPRFWVVTWPATTRVSVPTTKGGREERPWERDWKCTFSAPRNLHVINYAILSSYRNTIINQSARTFSLSYFLKKITKNWIIGQCNSRLFIRLAIMVYEPAQLKFKKELKNLPLGSNGGQWKSYRTGVEWKGSHWTIKKPQRA